ncbi:helix-turn-helix transcriptional regulator [Staphylococcus sp. 18_1_E_LY]|uniref:Helix-turn-helix transcriptional regulator n=1 Tax=Staphylococcus lloydii TaxID=2781774 RepID=A0A7T1AZQ5_9STAP|nr:helix-turn-helix transcriptional regulator [Staphylococcus lloydii]MBF7019652.1 helix-turn-helix transcriptional regulator [Staphylococcus lloydii]MBF7027380.1 helix-turn-helix transcriptional regulator [Staphylococcus lloydii]MDU9418985.1 helix-turn-helix transcriptional regulator [Staphylococcus lloydii]QPM75042.1 helix-turn-helix transcriptional regulator [Staphylococcus lloydii]
MNLYEKIKKLCSERGISIAHLERETGISNGQIKRWAKSSPSVENLKKVAKYFDVSLEFLADDNAKTTDPEMTEDIRIMQRAAQNMSEEDRKKAIKVFEAFFENWEDMTKDNKD